MFWVRRSVSLCALVLGRRGRASFCFCPGWLGVRAAGGWLSWGFGGVGGLGAVDSGALGILDSLLSCQAFISISGYPHVLQPSIIERQIAVGR